MSARSLILASLFFCYAVAQDVVNSTDFGVVTVEEIGFIQAYIPKYNVVLAFIAVAVATASVSKLAPNLGIPLITGYLLCGLVSGPFMLNLLSDANIRSLRIVNETALAYIALAAGSKFYFPAMVPVKKALQWLSLILVVLEYVVGVIVVILLAPQLAIVQNMTQIEQLAVAMLAGTMMVARSPSAIIAVVSEMKASGRYVNIIVGVTILCDAIVILFFNLNDLVAGLILTTGVPKSALSVIGQFFAQIIVSSIGGILFAFLSMVLVFWPKPAGISSERSHTLDYFKCFILITMCVGILILANFMEPYLDELFFFLVCGAFIANYTNAKSEFVHLLHELSTPVFVSFFTLTGAALKLSILGEAMLISSTLVITRTISIIFGSYLGNKIAGEDNTKQKYMWSGFLTQAGVTLGLAKRVQLEFPGWGDYFATMVVGCVLLNQAIGPPLLRWGLNKSGDVPDSDAIQPGVVIVDCENKANKDLIRTMRENDWEVVQVSTTTMNAFKVHKRGSLAEEDALETALRINTPKNLHKVFDDDEEKSEVETKYESVKTKDDSMDDLMNKTSEIKMSEKGDDGNVVVEFDQDDVSSPLSGAKELNASANGLKIKKRACFGLLPQWLENHFTLSTEVERFMAQYKTPKLSYIYDLLNKFKVDSFVITSENPAEVLELATTIARCHNLIAKKTHAVIRIVIVCKDLTQFSDEVLDSLSTLTKETRSSEYVEVVMVDPNAANVSLVDLAVRGGPMAAWLDIGPFVKRHHKEQATRGKRSMSGSINSSLKDLHSNMKNIASKVTL